MPRKISTRKRIRVLGDFLMFGIFLCLLLIFLHAWFNGFYNGEYTTIVNINSKNEAHLELFILLFILFPIFALTVFWSFMDWKSTWKARDQIRFSDYYFEPSEPPRPKLDTILMRCSACSEVFGITAAEDAMKIECPTCGRNGIVKLPEEYTRAVNRSRPVSDAKYDRKSSGPQVRIIKDIRDR